MAPTTLHAVHRRVEEHERATGRAVTRLHVGEPSFSPAPEVKEALARAAREGAAYTLAEGLSELREALAAKLVQRNRIAVATAHVLACPGSTQGLHAVMLALGRGDGDILLPAVHWPIHADQARLAGLRPQWYGLDRGMRIDVERLEASGTARTRAVVVNSPANPSGAVCDEATLGALVETAHRRGWWLISDEAYEDFVYAGRHISAASLEGDLRESERRVVSVFSFSKSHAMTGYRLGCIAAPSIAVAELLRSVQEALIVAPSTPVQHAGLAALRAASVPAAAHVQLAQAREMVVASLRPRLLAGPPAGGWYALVDVGDCGMSGERFAETLLAQCDVAVAPAAVFSADGSLDHAVRVAFCGNPEQLGSGLGAIHSLCGRAAA